MALKEPNKLTAIARIARPQGRRGEVVAEILTDLPSRFEELRRVFLENANEGVDPVTLENAWPHKGRIVLKFSGVDSIEGAERLRGRHVLVHTEEKPPVPADQYYVDDLKGCRVVREHEGIQSEVGIVTEVESTGGVALLHVAPREGAGKVLIPLAQAICTRIDPESKLIVIDPPEDLLDLNL